MRPSCWEIMSDKCAEQDLQNGFQKMKLSFGSSFAPNFSASTKSHPSVYKGSETFDSDKVSMSEENITKDVLSKVNCQIKDKTHSRLFAVIQFGDRRFKITTEDIIALNTFFPAKVGDKIRLEKIMGEFYPFLACKLNFMLSGFHVREKSIRECVKKPVLAVGSTDFTLLGRPVLSKDLLRIEATVIEKTYIIPRPLYRHGLHYRRLHWFRTPYVLFCINSIEFTNTLDSLPAVENVQNRVIY